jgi:DivIVA domain-containing protein
VLTGEDVDAVRLPVALRGYRFAEVDILLERLALELRRRDVEIARLRGEEPEAIDAPVPPEAYAPPEQLTPSEVTLTKADDATGDDRG